MSGVPPLVSAANGVQVPLYHDRLVLRAADLTVDRAGHDAALARMRRYLHGWGVVAGLVPVLQDDTLVVTRGYGVTPAGDELWLSEPLIVERAAERVVACCGPGDLGCELPDEPLEDVPDDPVVAWLVARVVHTDVALRPGVPDDCTHPVVQPLPTRRCLGVALELLCALPPSHETLPRTCEELTALMCSDGRRPPDPLPLPADPGEDGDLLVLCRLVAQSGDDAQLRVRLDVDGRRALLPTVVLQEHLQSCVCPRLRDEPVDGEEPERPRLTWDQAVVVLRRHDFVLEPDERPGSRRPLMPAVVRDRTTLRRLAEAGVHGPLALLDADLPALTERSGVPLATLEQAQREVADVAVLLRRR